MTSSLKRHSDTKMVLLLLPTFTKCTEEMNFPNKSESMTTLRNTDVSILSASQQHSTIQ